MYILQDPRIEEVIMIVDSIVKKSLHEYTKVLVTNTNTLVLIVSDTLLYRTELKCKDPYPDIAFIYSNLNEYCMNDEFLIHEMYITFRKYTLISANNRVLAQESNLRNNEEFERLLALKAADKLEFFKVPGVYPGIEYMVPMFSDFLSLNKQDDVTITINEMDGYYLLLTINIFKKKINRNVYMSCRILNI